MSPVAIGVDHATAGDPIVDRRPRANRTGIRGNQTRYRGDYLCMICEQARLALSARLDGEPISPDPDRAGPDLSDVALDEHLGTCAACTGWLAAAEAVTRTVRVPLGDVPDQTDRIMQAVRADAALRANLAGQAAPGRRSARADRAGQRAGAAADGAGRRQVLRLAVAIAAGVQLILAVPALLADVSGSAAGQGPHLSREMASFDIAVAVGFLVAAYRPQRARALAPIAIVLASCLALTSGLDVLNGSTAPGHEVAHLVTVVQAVLIWLLGRQAGDPAGPGRPNGVPRLAADRQP